jgi:hypothetical protein
MPDEGLIGSAEEVLSVLRQIGGQASERIEGLLRESRIASRPTLTADGPHVVFMREFRSIKLILNQTEAVPKMYLKAAVTSTELTRSE